MKVLYILHLKNNYQCHFKVFWEKVTCSESVWLLIIIDKGLIAFQSKFEFSKCFFKAELAKSPLLAALHQQKAPHELCYFSKKPLMSSATSAKSPS
jgi:hypothetical protein